MISQSKLRKGYLKFLSGLDVFSAGLIFVLMLLITTDVLSRSLFNRPFQGVAEIVSNCIIILCFLEIPYVLSRGSLVRTTMIYDKLNKKGKFIINIISYVLGIIVFVAVLKSSWGGFIKAVAINDSEIAGSVRIPTTPGRFSIIFGSVLMVIEYLFQIAIAIEDLVKESSITNTHSNINFDGGIK